MTSQLIILRGLPGAGKSHYAMQQVARHGYRRVNRDSLRQMMDNTIWSMSNEPLINAAADFIIASGLAAGYIMISDDTNIYDTRLGRLVTLASEARAAVVIVDIDTPLDLCIERDAQRAAPIGADAIRKLHDHWLKRPNIAHHFVRGDE